MNFTTFLMPVPAEFEPHLNEEHDGYQWADLDNAPEPLHPGVDRVLPMVAAARMGMDEAEWDESEHPRNSDGRFQSGGAPGPAAVKAKSSASPGSKVVMRPDGWNAGGEEVYQITRPGRLYRGMTEAEFKATVGAGKGILSNQDYSTTDEGTSLSGDAETAESYANYGRDDPRKTGKPTYLVEVGDREGATLDQDGYYKAASEIKPERISRIWEMRNENGAIVGTEIDPAAVGEQKPSKESATDETDPSKPPKPGQWFVVYRVGSSGELKNRNAGNANSVGSFLQRLDDLEGSQPVGAGASHLITAYRVKINKDFGGYKAGSRGSNLEGNVVGREVRKNSVSYSFPSEGGWESEKMGEVSLEKLRAFSKEHTGYESFDDMGGTMSGEMVRKAFKDSPGQAQDTGKSIVFLEQMTDDMAMDRAIADRIALDKESVRSYDVDGRLHITLANISKSIVNPYYGFEIPGAEEAGLDPRKVFYLLRDAQELAEGAETFNNIPILSDHKPVSAESPEKDMIVGSTGTDAIFRDPYLCNSLVFWDQAAIDEIESNAKRELSAAYRYVVDWTPGVFDGRRYDGVMRQIRGNHIALVRDGRAGSDVIVGDSQLTEVNAMAQQVLSRRAMLAKGALFAGLTPLLAQDALPGQTMKDLDKILAAVASDNWKTEKPKIIAEVTRTFTPRLLAKDQGMGGLAKLLDHLDGEAATAAEPGKGAPAAPAGPGKPAPGGAVTAKPMGGGGPPVETESALKEGEGMAEDDPISEIMEMLKAHLPPDVHAAVGEKMKGLKPNPQPAAPAAPAAPAPAAAAPAPAAPGTKPPAMDEPPGGTGQPKPPVSSGKEVPVNDPAKASMQQATVGAMDAAIAKAKDDTRRETMAQMRSIAEAETFVAPWVGKLTMAFDSAADVYKAALLALEIDIEGMHPDAYRPVLSAQPKPGEARPVSSTRIAQDASTNAGVLLSKILPNVAGRRVM